jgi:4a-hydroxytetrahydrobiopterin dehydratase
VGIGESQGAAKPGDEKFLLTTSQISRELVRLPEWAADGPALTCEVSAPDYPTAMQIVNEIGHLGEELGHHADIDIRWKHLTISLSSHTFGGVLPLDVVMAHRVNEVCRRVMNSK